MRSLRRKKLSHDAYRVGWICPLEVEQTAAMEMLDEEHESLPQSSADTNVYSLGSINNHNIVIAGLYKAGNCSAATVVARMEMTFPNLKYGLLVGIGGGVPVKTDQGMIRLGHIVVGEPTGVHSGAIQYDHGKAKTGYFERKGSLAPPPTALLHAARMMAVQRRRMDHDPIWENTQRIPTSRRALRQFKFPGADKDYLYQPDYSHQQPDALCEEAGCDPKKRIERSIDDEGEGPFIVVHRGTVASGESVIKDAELRDDLAREHKVLCFEMEAAGALSDFPCMVIRGISDYCDSHKNDVWHGFAAAVAAAYARELFFHMPIQDDQHGQGNHLTSRSHFVVPYTSNPDFVDRSDVLNHLKAQLGHDQPDSSSTVQARSSLYGLGGVGKTQIALAYVYWLHETSPDISVFWVHASNVERFSESFAAIAKQCQIPGYNNPKEDNLLLVKRWLENKDHGRWLMVVDNADDLPLFFSSPGGETGSSRPEEGNLGRLIPDCSHGDILCTTRNKQVGSRITKGVHLIKVGKMGEQESDQLLQTRLGDVGSSPSERSELSSRLEHLPLALVQAAAFICENSLSTGQYLQMLEKSLVDLLGEDFETFGRDPETPRAVAETWIISFQNIKRENPLAGNLLSLMSLLDRQAIPQKFLSYYSENIYESAPVGDLQLTKAIGILKAFSLVTEEKDGSLDLHRLVQLVTRKWLSREKSMQRFSGAAILTVAHMYPYGEYETRATCSAYLPHAYSVLELECAESKEEILGKASLFHHIAAHLGFEGSWNDAQRLQEQATDIRKDLLGAEHANTLDSIENLATIYKKQARWEKAEKLQVQVLEMRKTTIGLDRPETITSMHNLASIYRKQGRWKEAERLQVQVLETRKATLGSDHLDTATGMHSLAWIYRKQGRWQEAERLQVQALELRKTKLQADHPHTLVAMKCLAENYNALGRQEEAERLLVQVLATRKMKYGADHPDTLTVMGNLASTFWEQGRWEEAEVLNLQVLEMRKAKLGADHPRTLTNMNNLAITYQAQGRQEEAERLQVEVLEMRKMRLGTAHPDTLLSMETLAVTWGDMGKTSEAAALMRERVSLQQGSS